MNLMQRTKIDSIIRNWIKGGLLVLLVLIAYISVFHAGYLWDDVVLTQDTQIFQGWSGLSKIWAQPGQILNEEHYWPMVYTSFWIENQLWGLHPFSLHLINLIIHIINSFLVWQVLKKLGIPGSWLAGMIFALHPVQVESAAWIIERKGLLSTSFYLLAGGCFLKYKENNEKLYYGLAAGALALSLLCKSTGVGFPIAILLILYWRNKKLSPSDWGESIPFFLISLLIAGGDFFFRAGQNPVNLGYSAGDKIQHAFYALSLYLNQFFLPMKFMGFYPSLAESANHWPYLGTILLLGLAGAGCYAWILKQEKGLLIGFLFYCLTLLPVLGLIEFSFLRLSPAADRYQYLASLGLVAICATGLKKLMVYLSEKKGTAAKTAVIAPLGLVLCMGCLTFSHAAHYRDNESFFGYCVQRNPDSWYARSMLGRSLMEKNDWREAEYQFTKALEIWPDCPDAKIFLGSLKQQQNNYSEALQLYQAVKVGNPRMIYYARIQSARILMLYHQPADAINILQQAIIILPQSPEAYYQMGLVFDQMNQLEKANQAYRKALEIDWNLAQAHNNLGVNLAQAGNYTEAEKHFAEALRIDPAYESAKRNLTTVKEALKKL
jgi:tetratricopeptide (TPR) repeat protein